jgi:hypothetical protein
MSIRNGLLYADNATDLVAIDISNILAVKTVSRVENVFSEVYPEGKRIYVNSSTEGGVIVGWKVVTVEEKVDSQNNGMFYFNGSPIETISGDFSLSNATVDMTSKAAVDQTGMAGSLSRFLIYDDFLYTLESWKIDVFDIQKTSAPQKIKEIPCTWSAETLFINNKNLFVGTRDGMIIYSLADASQPEFISQLAHFRSCDPVAVSGNYAFVTLRTNENNCGQAVGNELEVISIENLKEPKVVAVYPMTAPRGVGIDGSTLFVCDGEAGLKIFNAADVLNIDKNQLIQYTDINATDVIPMGKYLLTLGTEGLSQYDYSDPKNIKRISSLTLK